MARRHGAHRRRVGHVPHRAAAARTAGARASRSSATPAARRRAPTASTTRTRASTASSSTRPSRAVGGAASGSTTTRGSPCTTADARPFLRRTRRALRPDPHRRLPAALRAVLPGDARVLPALRGSGSRPAASSPSTSPPCPATTASRRPSPARCATEFPQVVTWQALRFNQFVVGLTAPLPRAVMTARLLTAPARPPAPTRGSSPATCGGRPGRASLDRRPRPGRVGHRPHDRRLRRAAAAETREATLTARRAPRLTAPLRRLAARAAPRSLCRV